MSTSNSNLTSDRTYTLLLSHLHDPHTSLSLPTLQSALSHHLALLPPCTSSPTPLAATAISAPYYLVQPFTFTKLNSLSTSFRHAVHLKYRALKEEWEARGRIERLFSQSVGGSLDAWAKEVVKGLIGGHPVLRLACCSGLLLGIEDLGKKELEMALGARGVVEDEDIVALAEVMDTYAFSVTGGTHGVEEWEKEFQPAGQDVLSMALILAAQSVPLIPHSKLRALPLPLLSHLLTQTLLATFKHGSFLSSVSASVTLTPNNEVHISASSAFAHTIRSITSSPLTAHISDLARFMASVLSLLLPSSVGAVAQTMEALCDCAKAIERDWISTSLASVPGVATDTQDLTKAVWGILKTFLFTVLMVDDAALSAAVFIPPESSGAADLALTTLETLSHLAFVITQFGGVTSTSPNSFLELKKTFYLALDILAQTQSRAETYVERVCGGALEMRRGEGNVGFRQAKEAFVLAAVEQLVPVLGAKCLRESVWRVCEPHLFDASHRETFESAHSTVLAVFASHSQRTRAETPKGLDSSRAWLDRLGQRAGLVLGYSRKRETLSVEGEDDEQHENERTNDDEFVMRLVPFYAGCLLENSREGKLNTAQLRMAYAALVRGACACDSPMDGEGKGGRYVLAWYCVQRLLDAIHALEGRDAKGKGKGKEVGSGEGGEERLHRLRLVLMSTVSGLPLVLLAQALEEVRLMLLRSKAGLSHSGMADLQHSANSITVPVTSEQAEGMAKEELHEELVQALFAEILENVGDREKEWAGRWWYEHRGEFGIVGEGPDLGRGVGDEKSTDEGGRARL